MRMMNHWNAFLLWAAIGIVTSSVVSGVTTNHQDVVGHSPMQTDGLNDDSDADNQKRRLSEAFNQIDQQMKDRFLQRLTQELSLPPPFEPTRGCNEEIGVVTSEEIQQLATVYLTALFPNPADAALLVLAQSVLLGQVVYDMKLVKVCMSCNEASQHMTVTDDEDDSSSSSDQYSFQNICADGMYGVNETESAIVFIPARPFEVEEGNSFRGFIFGRGATIPLEGCPSERVPADWTQYIQDNEVSDIIIDQLDTLVPAVFGGVGAVGIMPDFLGYGEAYQVDRPFLAKQFYARSYVLSYLATREYIRTATSGCNDLAPIVSVGGYSEGGYSTIPGALGLQSMGIEITGAYPGGAVFQPGIQTAFFMDLLAPGATTDPELLGFVGTLGTWYAYSLSNEFPFFANTGSDQFLLSDLYRTGDDITTNALLWYKSPAQLGWGVLSLLPYDDLLSTINPDLIALYDQARVMGIDDACAELSSPETDKLCEAINEQSMIPELQMVDFPTVVCHSPDDEIITVKNAPTYPFSNPNVEEYTGIPGLNILGPAGSHLLAAMPCGISPILTLQAGGADNPAAITKMDMCLDGYGSASTGPPVDTPSEGNFADEPTMAPVDGTPTTGAPIGTSGDTPSEDDSGAISRMGTGAVCIMSFALALLM